MDICFSFFNVLICMKVFNVTFRITRSVDDIISLRRTSLRYYR